MKVYHYDRRQIYDTDYFLNGGIERRKGAWERRSGKQRRSGRDRRLTFDPKYMYTPERRSGVDRRVGERRGSLDRHKTHIQLRLIAHLGRLERSLEKRSGGR